MIQPGLTSIVPDIVLPDEPAPGNVSTGATTGASTGAGFDGSSTVQFQAKMGRAPEWVCSFLAGNSREKRRFRDELGVMKGAWPLLMKQRNGGKWTAEDKVQLKAMVRSASSVSPYLFIWAVPGSMLLLPFLAWFLDRKRKRRVAGEAQALESRLPDAAADQTQTRPGTP